jgi:hypothetical protein
MLQKTQVGMENIMWLRMVSKSPRCSRQMMLLTTDKKWCDWEDLLDAGNQQEKGIIPVMRYLIENWAVSPGYARSIAIQYVLRRTRTIYLKTQLFQHK